MRMECGFIPAASRFWKRRVSMRLSTAYKNGMRRCCNLWRIGISIRGVRIWRWIRFIWIIIGGTSLLIYKIKTIGWQNAALAAALLLGVEPHHHHYNSPTWNLQQVKKTFLSFNSFNSFSFFVAKPQFIFYSWERNILQPITYFVFRISFPTKKRMRWDAS